MPSGELFPCSAEAITEELLGDAINLIEPLTNNTIIEAMLQRAGQGASGIRV